MNKTVKKLIIANIIVLCAAISFIIIAKQLKSTDEYTCSLYTLTHIYCPGCGGTRAVFSLLKLDVISSLRYNAAVLPGVVIYLYYNVRAFVEALRNNREYFKRQKYTLCIIWAVILILNFLLKNLFALVWGVDIMPSP